MTGNVAIEPGFMPAVRLNFKTMGYLLPSFAYSTALSAVSFAIVAGTIGLSVVAFMYIHKYVAGAVMLLGFVPLVLFWVPFTWRKMFSMTAGHVAVMTELINTGAVQHGNDGMFKYGRNVIATRFGDREGFRAFHNRLENMLGHLMKSLDRLDELVPQLRVVRPYLARLRGLLMRHIQWVVLSYAVARGASNEDELKMRSLEATCYVVQNGMGLLKTALVVSVIERITERVMWFLAAVSFTLAVFVTTYTVGFSQPLPDFSHLDVSMLTTEAIWVSLIAACIVGPLVGYLVTSAYVEAVLRPFASTMVLLKFHKLIQNQPLKPEWAERIRTGGYAADRFDWLSFKAMR